jgi:hypothetical protein
MRRAKLGDRTATAAGRRAGSEGHSSPGPDHVPSPARLQRIILLLLAVSLVVQVARLVFG